MYGRLVEKRTKDASAWLGELADGWRSGDRRWRSAITRHGNIGVFL